MPSLKAMEGLALALAPALALMLASAMALPLAIGDGVAVTRCCRWTLAWTAGTLVQTLAEAVVRCRYTVLTCCDWPGENQSRLLGGRFGGVGVVIIGVGALQ